MKALIVFKILKRINLIGLNNFFTVILLDIYDHIYIKMDNYFGSKI